MRPFFLFMLSGILFTAFDARAYVAGPGSASKGLDVAVKLEWMRGLAGPQTLPETEQTQKPNVNIYEISAGYGLGSEGVFQDIRVRVSGGYFVSAAESLGGTLIYPQNTAGYFGGEISTNFVHDPSKQFGAFFRLQNPINMNVAKFVNPKIDRFGLGLNSAFRLSDSFSQETVLFIGSGISGGGFRQNASLAVSMLMAWVLPPSWIRSAALRMGPFYEGDIAQRDDLAYGTRGLRAFRLGLTMIGSVGIMDGWSMDLGYTRKFTGAYFRATDDIFISSRVAF